MLLRSDRLWQAIAGEFRQLCATIPDSDTDGSTAKAISTALALLQNRDSGGLQFLTSQIDGLSDVIRGIGASLPESPIYRPAIAAIITSLEHMRSLQNVLAIEVKWRETLAELQALVSRFNTDAALPRAVKDQITRALVAWESADLLSQVNTNTNAGGSRPLAVELTVENLSLYLRDRFNEPELSVSSFQALAGGFGKQTTLVQIHGKAVNGPYVIRRDLGDNAGLENDCHRIADEFPVVKAAFGRGFPAPDAVWLDTEHRLLPGGDFVVMRRSPGKLAGSFFAAQSKLPPDLADALADIMARLHALPPLLELGDLTDSIRRDLWSLSRSDCTARYIRNWYDYYLREQHTPSPALMGLYGWLLDNVPQRQGAPVLLHGDIGFHNFLFNDGALSAVLDWEFAHIGDPAEDIAYVKVTVGNALDWDRLMSKYVASGGSTVDAKTLKFFQVWAYVRNACAGNIMSTRFTTGRANDLKLVQLPHGHIPHFIAAAQAIIDST